MREIHLSSVNKFTSLNIVSRTVTDEKFEQNTPCLRQNQPGEIV